ncbi:hypothetical protein L1887_60523 [Cichorium endivia]|nr:hypothetical protein L1887_60523 [Cichorium endivia]
MPLSFRATPPRTPACPGASRRLPTVQSAATRAPAQSLTAPNPVSSSRTSSHQHPPAVLVQHGQRSRRRRHPCLTSRLFLRRLGRRHRPLSHLWSAHQLHGKVLAKIMSKEPSLRTYADIGSYAFGPSARILISLFFCLELWAVSVALIILFGDSMAAIFPDVAPSAFKLLGYLIVLPSVFLPLKFLSPISVIGIVSTFTLVVVVVSDGPHQEAGTGSLWEIAPTTLGPRWNRLPLSFGLIMSGFSSHPIIPSLVRDMKDPAKFPRMLNLAYVAATVLYLGMGLVGYAMFGVSVSDEITKDLARTPGFPHRAQQHRIWLIVINPLSKFALATRPIQTTFEILLGIDDQTAARMEMRKRRRSSAARSITKAQYAKPASGALEAESETTDRVAQLTTEATGTPLSVSPNQRVSFATPQVAAQESSPGAAANVRLAPIQRRQKGRPTTTHWRARQCRSVPPRWRRNCHPACDATARSRSRSG